MASGICFTFSGKQAGPGTDQVCTAPKHRVLKVGVGHGGPLYALTSLLFHPRLKFFMVFSRDAKNQHEPPLSVERHLPLLNSCQVIP